MDGRSRRASGKAPEKSLRLQALMNHFVNKHLADAERAADVTAVSLFALTEKSLAASRLFAPSNARDLVMRRHRRLMERLREAAAAAEADAASGAAGILQEARRLKELSQELQASSGQQLKRVRSPRVARQLCRMFRLGDEAFAAWEQRCAQQGTRGSSAASSSSSPGGSPSAGPLPPSPPPTKRSKRKTPDKARAGRSRFGEESRTEAAPAGGSSAAAAGEPAAGGEPPRRRRISSEEGEPSQAVLAPKQLFGSGQSSATVGAGTAAAAAAAGPGPQLQAPPAQAPQPCSEWAAFRAFVATPPRAPASSGAGTAAASGAAAVRAVNLASTTQPDVPVASLAPAQAAECVGGRQPMEVDSSAEEAMEMLTWQLTGRLPPAADRLAPLAAAAAGWSEPTPPAELPPIPALLLSPRQAGAALPQAGPPLSPGKLAPWGLLLPSPACKENSSSGRAVSRAGSLAKGAGRVSAGAASSRLVPAFKPPHAAADSSAMLPRSRAAEREAAARDIITADIMLLLRECSQAGDGGTAMVCEAAEAATASSGVGGMVGAACGSSARGKEGSRRRGTPMQPPSGRRKPPSQLAIPAGEYGVLLVGRRAVKRQAAQQAPEVGGELDAAATFQALNGRGRAHTILQPLLPTGLQPGALTTQCC